jgi:hypothetical protein
MALSTSATKQQKVIMVCVTCGSEDVVVDAWAAWDADKQQWKLAGTLDYTHCCQIASNCDPLFASNNDPL